jgi:intracellular septation protein
MPHASPMHPGLKLALELGPLVVFFVANGRFGIFAATGLFMAAIAASLAVSYVLTRHLPMMALVSGVIVAVFGSLTLLLQDETFIKLKPTIIYVIFAAVLAGGLWFGRPLLALVFDSIFTLTEEGWRKLTIRWSIFFAAMALLNEAVWRTQSTDVWVAFKLFGFVPLTFVFAMLQYPLLQRYDASSGTAAAAGEQPAEEPPGRRG